MIKKKRINIYDRYEQACRMVCASHRGSYQEAYWLGWCDALVAQTDKDYKHWMGDGLLYLKKQNKQIKRGVQNENY